MGECIVPSKFVMSLFEPLDAAPRDARAAVDVAAPVPPFATVRGFWSVRLLNVGDGYV
ncbi:hypothetical protein BVI434_450118 [Burkholderia vietnamiensis]|nr:hypothetical protein BVI434_450118 [Burkholderia vietnamiensis]